MRLYSLRPSGSVAFLEEDVPLGCAPCLSDAAWQAARSVATLGRAHATATSFLARLRAVVVDLFWCGGVWIAGPTRWLRGALGDAGISYRDFLAGVAMSSPGPPLKKEEQVEQGAAIVMLLRTAAVAFGAGADSQWRSVRVYLQQFFDSQPDVFEAIDPGPRAPDAPTTDEVLAACDVVRRTMAPSGDSGLLLLLHMMLGVASATGKPSPSQLDRIGDVMRQCGLAPAVMDPILAAMGHERDRGPSAEEENELRARFENTDPWVVFGLTRPADRAKIRRRYLELVMAHHPDRVGRLGEAYRQAADRRLAFINAAYRRLQARA